MKRTDGFSLIELLIVVAIILVIAAIAIPRLVRARIAANEASAAASLKAIGVANIAYSSLYSIGYAGQLAALGPSPGAGGCSTVGSNCADLVDSLLSGVAPANSSPLKNGYHFTYKAPNSTATSTAPNTTYSAVAAPDSSLNGVSTFCFDNRVAIIRDSSGTQTSADDTGCNWPIGGSVGPL